MEVYVAKQVVVWLFFIISIWNLWALDFWGWLWKFVVVGKGWQCLFKNSPALLPLLSIKPPTTEFEAFLQLRGSGTRVS